MVISRKSGFTLVELLVVISIIGILSGFLFINFANVRERSRDSRRKSDLEQVKNSLRLYYNDFQAYPINNGSGQILGCGANGTSACEWGGEFATDSVTFMSLPLDPINVSPYIYTYQQTNNDTFLLQARMENLADPEIERSQERCGANPASTDDNLYMVCVN